MEKWIKIILTAFLTMFLFSGCGLFKKITKTEKSKQTTEKSTETTKDSTTTVKESQPTESQITLDIQTLSEMIGDFEQRVASGDGNESVITKKNGKLTITNKNSGSKDTQTNVNTDKKETIYTSEFVIKETRKVISRLPWWIWAGVIIWLLIVFRKFIAQFLIFVFPPLAGFRLLQLFVGNNPSK